jgi:hypothetical protein
MQRLLADLAAGHIDCVIVYKVDRLSRSLLDFAKVMQVFEDHRVAFVSVTRCAGPMAWRIGKRARNAVRARRKRVLCGAAAPLFPMSQQTMDPEFAPGS